MNFLLKVLLFWAFAASANAQCFNDADLAELAQHKKNALLYVWSPRMVLSATEAADVARLAQSNGLVFLPLHDPRVGEIELTEALKRLPHTALASSRSLCSKALMEAEATRHFPSSFMVSNGSFEPLPLVGAMPAAHYQQALQSKLSAKPSAQPSPSQCIPQNEFIALPQELAGTQTDAYGKTSVALGSYERVSPDGRFILRSYSGVRFGDVSLVELSVSTPDKASSVLRVIPTALSNEAFPVQGTWRYLVSTSGEHFALADIVANGPKAKPLFKGGMTGFYAAAAELPVADIPLASSSTPAASAQTIRIRSLSWPNATGDSTMQGEGALAVRTITVDVRQQRIMADTGHQNICGNRLAQDGALYALPMISVDGQAFSALPLTPKSLSKDGKQAMRIYSFGASGNGCEFKASLDFSSGKTIFGFGANADLTYEYKGQTWWFNHALGTPLNLAPFEAPNAVIRKVDASAFPGITQDGRVIYGATWERCERAVCKQEGGYIVSDPYQSNAYKSYLAGKNITAPQACIVYADIARERHRFATLNRLQP